MTIGEYREHLFRELKRLHWKNPQLIFQMNPNFNSVVMVEYLKDRPIFAVAKLLNHKWMQKDVH